MPNNPCRELDVPALTVAIAQGDEGAFEQLYHAIFAPLYGYLLVCARGREQEVKEALQETLIRITRRMKPFKDSAGLWNWICCIGRNALIDQVRRSKRFSRRLSLPSEGHLVQEEQDGLTELKTHLDHCLTQLSPAERALIQGKYLETKTHRILAQEHQLTPKAVESRLARIRKKLKTLMLKRLNP
jgi:RNA polymerase sigma-70 factor (ECF subfamily)